MSMKKCVFLQKFLFLLIFLLHFGVSEGDNAGRKAKRESNYLKQPILVRDYNYNNNGGKISVRQSDIGNRDSYLEAANSFSGQEGQGHDHKAESHSHHHHHHHNTANSYQVPQSSYNTPSTGYGQSSNSYGYGMQMHHGGYDDHDEDDYPQKTKGKGGVGLIGLLGLKGLKGAIGALPLLKLFGLSLLALAPLLIPLSLLKFVLILLKPVITFSGVGRGKSLTDIYDRITTDVLFDEFATFNNSGLNENNTALHVNKNTNDSIILLRELLHLGIIDSTGLFGRELEMGNQCMQRIACEGVLKSIPRIFLRILGENYSYKKVKKRRSLNEDGEKKHGTLITSRRKDLATMALKKLKNPQFIIKQPSLTQTSEATEACRQYKCATLF